MKSSIKIALGENREPVIDFIVAASSDDLRDHVCQDFIQTLGGVSNYCLIEFKGNIGDFTNGVVSDFRHWRITPIKPSDIPAIPAA